MIEPAPPPESLAAAFGSRFSVGLMPAHECDRIFRLRYRVFCEELGYGMSHEDGHESDGFDAEARHCLLRHAAAGLDIGCFRLLTRSAERRLPCEAFGLPFVDPRLLDLRTVSLDNACEVSRLALAPDFRRPLAFAGDDGRSQRFPFAVIGLYYAVIGLILAGGHPWALMVGEPRLQRHLLRWGILWRQISPPFEHYGSRAVFITSRDQLQQDIDSWPPPWRELYEQVQWQLRASER